MEKKTKSLFVSIVGKPNVGKSSLMNMMVNSKISITSPKPQTTRNRINGILTDGDTQLVFIDTPGIHKPFNKLSEYMNTEIENSFSGIEVCLHVIDVMEKAPDLKLIDKFKRYNLKVILVINKIDLLKDKSSIIKIMDKYNNLFNYEAIIPISAVTCDGKTDLLNQLMSMAEPSVFYFDPEDITNQTERMLVSEIIREKLLYFLDKELPHGTAVEIESFKRRENKISIHAIIYCERENHKSMIIGAGGKMIKNIGIAARGSLKDMFQCNVDLRLFVKVTEDWRNRANVLNDFGYR